MLPPLGLPAPLKSSHSPTEQTRTSSSSVQISTQSAVESSPYCRRSPEISSALAYSTAVAGSAQVGEEELDLALGRLGRVRPVHDVVLHLEGEVPTDRAGQRLHRVGRAGQSAERLD